MYNTRYRERQHVQRYPRDDPYNDPQYTQQLRPNRQFYTSPNVHQTQRYPTRINRPESYQSHNNRNRRQSPPYNAPVRDGRILRESRPRYVNYYQSLQQAQLQQPQYQNTNIQNSINTSTLRNNISNNQNNNNNNNNNNDTNVGAHGLYEHLEVEKSMGVSPAPEIRVNNNLDDSIPRKNKHNIVNKTIVSSVNNINNNNNNNTNNINDNNSNQVHLVPLQTTRNQDGQNRSQDVRYSQNTFINKDKTHLSHRPLPLKPGVYINRQIINHHNNRNKDKRKHEERNFIQQYPNTSAYKEALQQSLSRYKHQQQLQQATSYISQGGSTSLAYDIMEDYQNNSNNTNINTKKKSKSKKKSKQSNTNNTTQIPQVGYSKFYPSYDHQYNQPVRGAISYDGNWYPFPTYPDPYLVQMYENKKSNQKSSSSRSKNNTKQSSEPEDKSRSVRKQVEFYFSDKNLKNDTYTKALMNKNGWVRASDLHAFPRLKRMGANSDMILKACENSKQIEVRGRYIRKKNDWQKFLPDLNDTSKDTIKAIVTKIENIQKRIKNTEKAKKKQTEKKKEEQKEQNQPVDDNNNNNNNNNDNDNNNDNNKNNNNNTNTKQSDDNNSNNENTTNNTETSSEFEKISKSTTQVQSINTSFEENDKNNENTQPTNTSGSQSGSGSDDDMICID